MPAIDTQAEFNIWLESKRVPRYYPKDSNTLSGDVVAFGTQAVTALFGSLPLSLL